MGQMGNIGGYGGGGGQVPPRSGGKPGMPPRFGGGMGAPMGGGRPPRPGEMPTGGQGQAWQPGPPQQQPGGGAGAPMQRGIDQMRKPAMSTPMPPPPQELPAGTGGVKAPPQSAPVGGAPFAGPSPVRGGQLRSPMGYETLGGGAQIDGGPGSMNWNPYRKPQKPGDPWQEFEPQKPSSAGNLYGAPSAYGGGS